MDRISAPRSGISGQTSSAQDVSETRLSRTSVPGVLRLEGPDPFELDVVNIRGQELPDGLVTQEDAIARGVSLEAFTRATAPGLTEKEMVDELERLFRKRPESGSVVELELPGGATHEVSSARGKELDEALATVRQEVDKARSEGLPVIYPVRSGDTYRRAELRVPRGAMVIDPANFQALALSAPEAAWFFHELSSKPVRTVLSDGRVHYMSDAMKTELDGRVSKVLGEIREARARGHKSVYVSTFISSRDIRTNRAIAKFVEKRLEDDPQQGDVFVVNPADLKHFIPEAVGDDYMYMWESLIKLNVFDMVRFTSREDTKAYFQSLNQPVPKEYLFSYGDFVHSAGARYEWNLFAGLNREIAKTRPDWLIPVYHGDKPVTPPLSTMDIETVSYAIKGEVTDEGGTP